MGILTKRREETQIRLSELRNRLERAKDVLDGKACVYLTGSTGRGEASEHSDLDLFIVGLEEQTQRKLTRLDEIIVKAELIRESRALKFPDFSGDGEFLTYYTVGELCGNLGDRSDDYSNTFTARLLLLLESRSLLGEDVYTRVIDDVIAAYWKDFEEHPGDFVPAFLANDIIRLWKTFCVNYEARTQKEPPKELAKRKLLNYKLKHSRMITCYSALFHLLWLSKRQNTVTPDDVKQMVRLSPTQRLEWLGSQDGSLGGLVEALLRDYSAFLQATDAKKEDLLVIFADRERAREQSAKARAFGERVFNLLQAIGTDSPLYRFLIV